jgi:hypothetical protein
MTWISVEDRLPENSGFVWTYSVCVFKKEDIGHSEKACFYNNKWHLQGVTERFNVKFWMPLPDKPE